MRLLIWGLVTILGSSVARAGTLDQLESDVSQKREKSRETKAKKHSHHDRHHDHHSDDDDDSDATLAVMLFPFMLVYAMGLTSSERQRSGRRLAGEALIPMARLDVSGQRLARDVYALRLTGELGWGGVALDIDATFLEESRPRDTLGIIYTTGVVRGSFGDAFELDLAAGASSLNREHGHLGFTFGVPVRVHPSHYVGIELRPMWSWYGANVVTDLDASLLFGVRFASLKLGYRMLRSENVDLKGPSFGLSLRW